jgi:hypothetical protein
MLPFVSLLLAAAPAVQPIYLQCNFPKNGAVLDVSVDESNAAVTTVLRSSGYTEKYPAAFTATEVRFQNDMLAYVLSRTDLSIQRTIKLLSSSDSGTCTIQVPPKRAF